MTRQQNSDRSPARLWAEYEQHVVATDALWQQYQAATEVADVKAREYQQASQAARDLGLAWDKANDARNVAYDAYWMAHDRAA